MDLCSHRSGDYIHGIWVCAHCFRPLRTRPCLLGMVGEGSHFDGARQEIVWKAKIATDSKATTFGAFLKWMVTFLRLRSRWTIDKDEARQQCLELLRDMNEPFGSDGACWTRADAQELVAEGIISYWDDAISGAVSNGVPS